MNKEISPVDKLQKVIEYAFKNGYKLPKGLDYFSAQGAAKAIMVHHNPCVNTYIFNEDFLKSVFGEEEHIYKELGVLPTSSNRAVYIVHGISRCGVDGDLDYASLPAYQHHAQQMVISEDPIDYIYKWITQND